MRACSYISFVFLMSISLGHAQEMRLKVQDARLKTPLSDSYIWYGGQVLISVIIKENFYCQLARVLQLYFDTNATKNCDAMSYLLNLSELD